MDNETLIPNGPFSSQPSPGPLRGRGGSPIGLILIVLLGLGTVIFGVLTIFYAGKATTSAATLNTKIATAAKAAADAQKVADDTAYTKQNESPYRSYTAPNEYGSFTISFPKNWSSYVDHEAQGKQVSLALNPDFIHRTNGSDDPMATRVILQERTKDQYVQQYSTLLKNKTMKQVTITVSGLTGYEFTGKFPDRKTLHEVVVPIRDKVLIFSNENAVFEGEFNTIVKNAKLIP